MFNFTNPPPEVIYGMKLFYSSYAITGIIFGLAGSSLTVVVTVRTQQLRQSTRLFQGLLATFDALVLLTSGLRYIFLATSNLDFRFFSAASCRWHTYITYVAGDMATWLLCALTLERFLLVTWPTLGHASRPKRTLHCALVISGLLICLGLGKNTVLMWRVYKQDLSNPCKNHLGDHINTQLHSTFDMTLSLVIPNLLVIISCCGILKILGRKQGLGSIAPVSLNTGVSNATPIDPVTRAALLATKMMLGIGLVYLVTSLPSFVYTVLTAFPETAAAQYEEQVGVNLIYEGLMILQLSGNMSRFYVYVLASRLFRTEFRKLCSRSVLMDIER